MLRPFLSLNILARASKTSICFSLPHTVPSADGEAAFLSRVDAAFRRCVSRRRSAFDSHNPRTFCRRASSDCAATAFAGGRNRGERMSVVSPERCFATASSLRYGVVKAFGMALILLYPSCLRTAAFFAAVRRGPCLGPGSIFTKGGCGALIRDGKRLTCRKTDVFRGRPPRPARL